MPTGYTATLMENGQTFQDFVMGCARAFGALIDMRDSPNDAPIPDKFEPSDYYVKRLIESREKLAQLKAMTDTEKDSFGQAEKAAEIQRIEQWLEKDQVENTRLEVMAAQVQAWNPPTNDHRGIKDFMVQQLRISTRDVTYVSSLLVEAVQKPAVAYYVGAISEAARNVQYFTAENAKEIERAEKKTEWVKRLRESL